MMRSLIGGLGDAAALQGQQFPGWLDEAPE